MALPRINDVPLYTVTVPSSGTQVKFRPFLVREQKVLMVAFESQDENQLITAMMETVNSCCEGLEANKLTKIDIDYIFAMIRAKSVGENISLLGACDHCSNEEMQFNFNINDLKMPELKNRTQTIKLNDTLGVKMRVPSYPDIVENNTYQEDLSQQEMISRMMLSCIDSVQTEEENILMKDEPYEEKVKFIDYLTVEQFQRLVSFITEIPNISYDIQATCESCGGVTKKTLEGIENFF